MGKPPTEDESWRKLEPLLPEPKARRKKYHGGKPVPDRAVLNGIVFVLCTWSRWPDLRAEMCCGSA
ncbi:transposase [Robbsia andropogonis]|uniref:transposase n=1 Tax=Robbsia andropogonis TaxID=28092 RepID=UPI003D21FBDB